MKDVADASLQMAAIWCIGEFGEMLLQGQGAGKAQAGLCVANGGGSVKVWMPFSHCPHPVGGPLLENEPPLEVTELEVAQIVEVTARKAAVGSLARCGAWEL